MSVHDLWFKDERVEDPNTGKMVKTGKKVPSASHNRGKRWRVDWVDPDTKKTLTQKFDKKMGPGGADEWDSQVNADISRGKYIDPRAGQVTVAEYAEKWRAAQIHDGSTAAGVERFFRLHVLPTLGNKAMAELKRSTLQTWVKGRADQMAASSLGTGWVYVKAMFTTAFDDDVIGKNPCTSVSLPPPDKRKYHVATPAQVHQLSMKLAAIRPGWAPVPFLAAGCGLRPSEALGLELEHVDFLRREVRVRQQVKWTKARGVHIAAPKTKLSSRDVDLPTGVAEKLSAHIAGIKVFKPVRLWDWTNERKPVERDVHLLFTTPEREAGDASRRVGSGYEGGRPIYGGYWSDVWRDVVAAVDGLPAGYGLHDLRHYFATLLIHKGKSVKTVQMALGHSTPMVTLNTYTHEWPDVQDRTRDIVDAELFADDISVGDDAVGK
ncbi:tyrosine-type recombinase/integrase [Amycolatopsis kentuckyensis]|uniref:tyrosine-type recombinase/integrase n=1 Tax=Amycolatopsis kentuckyensis TaxID=218823 RepID=UPI000A36E9A2|nr:site-specific integrase [Amycolatopsis kentuckyensis]